MANSLTGFSAQKEQQFQERALLRLASRYEGMYRREIYKTMNQLARYPRNTGKQAEILANHGQAIKKILESEYEESFILFSGRIKDSIQKSHNKFETKRSILNTDKFDREKNLWIIQNASRKVTQIAGTTDEQALSIINDVLTTANREGLGEIETGRLLTDTMRDSGGQLSSFRGRMISRTEGHAASQASQKIMVQSTDIPMQKLWAASGGERTRDTHSHANGQSVGIDEKFIVGGEKLDYPGDPSGSADEVINCRCIAIYEPI